MLSRGNQINLPPLTLKAVSAEEGSGELNKLDENLEQNPNKNPDENPDKNHDKNHDWNHDENHNENHDENQDKNLEEKPNCKETGSTFPL